MIVGYLFFGEFACHGIMWDDSIASLLRVMQIAIFVSTGLLLSLLMLDWVNVLIFSIWCDIAWPSKLYITCNMTVSFWQFWFQVQIRVMFFFILKFKWVYFFLCFNRFEYKYLNNIFITISYSYKIHKKIFIVFRCTCLKIKYKLPKTIKSTF